MSTRRNLTYRTLTDRPVTDRRITRRLVAAHGDQRGLTLVETMLALALSVMLLLPMMGWAQTAMQQQVAVRERNIAGTSLGLLRSYFLSDVATAHRAVVDGEELTNCGKGPGGDSTPLLALLRGDQRTVYSIAPTEDSDAGLWRQVCRRDGTSDSVTVELVAAVLPKVTTVDCSGSVAPSSTLQQAQRLLGDDEDGGPADGGDAPNREGSNGRLSSGQRINGAAPSPTAGRRDATACRRVNLRVTTPDLRQVAMSAVVRADGLELDDADDLPVVALAADPLSGPAPLKVAFTSAGSSDPRGGRLAHRWDFGDGSGSDEADPVHVFERPGEYSVTLTVIDELGAEASASIVITATNTAPVAVIASPANATRVARGELIRFSSLGSNDDADAGRRSTITYAWDFGNGVTSTQADPTVAYPTLSPPAGYPVTLTVTDSDGGTATARIDVIVVNRIPSVTIVADRTSGASPLRVDFASLVSDETTMAVNPALAYFWEFGDGTTSTLADPPAVTYTGAGTRTARLTVTDDAGATASATQVITLTSTAIAAPTDLRLTNRGVEQGLRFVEMAWNRVEGADRYEVRLTCVSCTEVATGSESGTTLRIRGLSPGRKDYYAQVRARSAATGLWGPWTTSIVVRS